MAYVCGKTVKAPDLLSRKGNGRWSNDKNWKTKTHMGLANLNALPREMFWRMKRNSNADTCMADTYNSFWTRAEQLDCHCGSSAWIYRKPSIQQSGKLCGKLCVDKIFQSSGFGFCSASFITIKQVSFAMALVIAERLTYFRVCDMRAESPVVLRCA